MDYEKMRVAELKTLTRERGLRGYSRVGKAELIALLLNNPPPRPPPAPQTMDLQSPTPQRPPRPK